MDAAAFFFWFSFLFIGYTYAGYPIAIWCAARLRPENRPLPISDPALPAVTVVIAVHNEALRIEKKLGNLRSLDYPKDRLKFIFVSDGSSDETNSILGRQPDVTLVQYTDRRGKPHALNQAMKVIETPVVVFADVRQSISEGALRSLVQHLMQPGVGVVSGELVHVTPGTQTAAQIGLYWRYEKWIRKAESRFRSTVGATGALFAMRTAHYTPLSPDTILDDFEQPMLVARRGLRVVFDSQALIFDELQSDIAGERKRKIRTLSGNFQSFACQRWLFSPLANPLWLQFISHMVFRLFVPYALAILLVSTFWMHDPAFTVFGFAQLGFYLLALIGRLSASTRKNRLVSFAGVFVEMNWAAVLAMKNWLSGGLDARWEKT